MRVTVILVVTGARKSHQRTGNKGTSRDLRALAVTQTPVKDNQLTLVGKNSLGVL